MFQLFQEVTITLPENIAQYPHLQCVSGVITGIMVANHVGDQRTLYDVVINDSVYFLYEDEILPLYAVVGLH